MKIVSNTLEGKYAEPKDHPVTCANPAPWKIDEMKIGASIHIGLAIWIRNKESMWFRADQCFIGRKEDFNL